MNCAKTSEFLPWYVNGTLEPEIEQRVARHVAECESCARDLADTKQAFEVFSQHLPTDWLLDLADGSLDSSVDRATVEQHLQECPSCTEALDLVSRSQRTLDAQAEILAFEPKRKPQGSPIRNLAIAASILGLVATSLALWSWRELAVRDQQIVELSTLRQPAAPIAPGPSPQPAPTTGGQAELIDELRQQNEDLRSARRDLEDNLAESVATGRALRTKMAELAQPLLNALVVDLFPEGILTRAPTQSDEIVNVAARPGVVVILNSQLEGDVVPARIRLRRGDDVVWELGGVTRNPTGDFTLTLSNQGLDAGNYVIELLAEPDEDSPALESFRLRVR